MTRDRTGVIVFGHTRAHHLYVLLESLYRQNVAFPVHVWLDGHHGRKDLKKRVERCSRMVAERFPQARLKTLNGHIGIEKMTINGLGYMCERYERTIVLEDDCFPTANCMQVFSECLDLISENPGIFSVYGHHFLMPSENETITRFQGWGWASTRDKILPILSELRSCFAMPEEHYLRWVQEQLTPEIERRLNVTPPRNCLVPLSMFFCWDACLSLLTALRGLVHMKTPQRVIYNCGMGKESAHFTDGTHLRKPPFNLISVEEVWDHYYPPDRPKTDVLRRVTEKADVYRIRRGAYEEVLEDLAQAPASEEPKRTYELLSRLTCHLGLHAYKKAQECFLELKSAFNSDVISEVQLARIGCMLHLKKYEDIVEFIFQQFFLEKSEGIHSIYYLENKSKKTNFDSIFSNIDNSLIKCMSSMLVRAEKEPLFDKEIYYKLGIEMHHTANELHSFAAQVYINIINDNEYSPSLKAWAHFKYGEILEATGKPDEAQKQFQHTVELDPLHAKANIALQQGRPLSVIISSHGEEAPGYITVTMDIFDRQLWDYYFQGRKIQRAGILLPKETDPAMIRLLNPMLEEYMMSGGKVFLLCSSDNQSVKQSVFRDSPPLSSPLFEAFLAKKLPSAWPESISPL